MCDCTQPAVQELSMPEDRKKMPEALVAKRKAGGNDAPQKRTKNAIVLKKGAPPLEKAKPAVVVGRGGGEPQQKGKPRAKKSEKWSNEESGEDEEDEFESESEGSLGEEDDNLSEDELTKKLGKKGPKMAAKPPPKKPGLAGKGRAKAELLKSTNGKDKPVVKDKGKAKKDDDVDDDLDNDEDDEGNLSSDPNDELDPKNILPSRTRRQAAQPVQYDFAEAGSDDEDDDDENE